MTVRIPMAPGRRCGGSGDEAGFTLLELVISIGILGIVMLAISGTMLAVMRVDRETQQRTDTSTDGQIAVAYFTDDVYGAQSISQGGTAICGSTSPLIEFVGTSFSGDPVPGQPAGTSTSDTQTVVDYYLSGTTLHRVACTVTGSVSGYGLTPDTDHTLARYLTPGSASVQCYDKAQASVACTSTGVATVLITTVESDNTRFQLAGTRRLS